MNVQQAYNVWSENYDTVENKTRDLEAKALLDLLSFSKPLNILEIGCGTGKNTEWLMKHAKHIVGVDFSAEMLAQAKAKITAENVEFREFDLRDEWDFKADQFDLITCSLALEHIENIDFVFQQAHRVLVNGGLFYIGELHPFKQYLGSKAKFETDSGLFEIECFIHHVSEFFSCGKSNNFECLELKEWFDDDDKSSIPRLISFIFRAQK